MTKPNDTQTDDRTAGSISRDHAEAIGKLLAQAESVAGTPEADAFMARAQKLMAKYAIDEAMVRAAHKLTMAPEELIVVSIPFTGIFKDSTMRIAFAAMRANNCNGYYVNVETSTPKRVDVLVHGFESDVRNVELITTSLQLQCATAMSAWWKRDGDREYGWSKGTAYKAKREFIKGFGTAVAMKLAEAQAVAEAEATKSHVAAGGMSDGVSLVLRDRKDTAQDWYDTKTAALGLRSRARRQQSGGMGARVAGTTAGRSANIGGTAVGNSTKSIGR